MLQYAGVDLLTPDPGGWLESFLQRTALDSLDLFGASPVAACDRRTQAVGSHQPITPYPIPNYRAAPPLKLNQLYWPSGAARWSTFVGLIDSDGLDKIKTKLTKENVGSVSTYLMMPLPFIMADSNFEGVISETKLIDNEDRAAIHTPLYMLEPRALSTPKGRESLWLLPLVDVRYFWQYKKIPHRIPPSFLSSRVTEANVKETWNGWLDLLQESLDNRQAADQDVTLEFLPATVTSEYFYPDRSELHQEQHNAAVVLDALAHSCGRRFVRQVTGECELIDAAESLTRHNGQLVDNTGGGISLLSHQSMADIDAYSVAKIPLEKMAVYPQKIDVVFRQLGEFDLDDVPADETFLPAPYNVNTQVLAGTGTRTIRNDSRLFGARSIVERTQKTVYTPSWVGRYLWHDGTSGDCPEPAGSIDNAFYGDRYFRLAAQISEDFVAWKGQQHEYDLPGFQPWLLSGFDDAVTWDHQRGSTHIRSHSNDFGVSTQLVQVHRQCSFDPNMVVGVISSAWTLYPEGGQSCTLEVETDETPTTDTVPGTIEDVFDYTWQWAECFVRPFIPTDPWAATDSIQYARTMVSAGEEIVAITRSQSIIEDLRDRVPDPDSVLGATADDRIIASPNAAGVVYLRRYGCEWQVIWADCEI